MRHTRQKHGFTLVELLVVISIISVLVALLLPSLASARDRAKTVLCMGRQKHLIYTITMYGNDYQQLVPGGPYEYIAGTMPYQFSTPDQGFSVAYRSNWYVGGTILWTDKRHTQQMLRDYIDTRSGGWMCPGLDPDQDLNPGDAAVGSPSNPGAGPVPFTMANIGFGYSYRPWLRKVQGWYNFQNYILRTDGPHNPSAADLFACLYAEGLVPAPHMGNKIWNISYLDGSVRGCAGMAETIATGTMYVNTPVDGTWSDWSGP